MVMPRGEDICITRDEACHRMRMVGLFELADMAAEELPDPVDGTFLFSYMWKHGYNPAELKSKLGGSP